MAPEPTSNPVPSTPTTERIQSPPVAIFSSGSRKCALRPDEKAAIAQAWVDSVRSGSTETQAAFARRHGLSSPRVLRAWVRRYVPGTRWEPELRQAIKTAIAALNGIAEVMDRLADGLSAPRPSASRPNASIDGAVEVPARLTHGLSMPALSSPTKRVAPARARRVSFQFDDDDDGSGRERGAQATLGAPQAGGGS